MNWRKIRDTSEMNKTGPHRTENLHGVRELAAWPDVWMLRGGSSVTGHVLYGLDMQANRLAWTLDGLPPPEDLGWSWKRLPLLAKTADLAVVASYVGRNRERVWLLAVEPRKGELAWRKPLAWFRRPTSGKTIYEQTFFGIATTGAHLVVMENRAQQGEEPFLLWLDPTTGETVHACPAPVSKDPAVVTGGFLYFIGARGREQGLYRVPAAPGADAVEQLLDTFVVSLSAQGDSLYLVHTQEDEETGDLLDWTFVCWDARTLEVRASCVRHWDDDRNWPRLMTTDPAHPDHVVAHRDTLLWGLDLGSGETLWEHTVPFSTSIKQVLLAPHDALLNADQGVQGLDLLTGARSDLGMDGVIEHIVAAGDYLLTSHGFHTGSCLYVAQETPGDPAHPGPTSGDETWTRRKLRDLLPDLLTDPRDELQALFAKAAGRRSLTSFFKAFRRLIGAGQVHKKVKDYLIALKAGELDAGPLYLTPFADLHRGCFFYPDLFGFGPEERFFPGLLFASETYGVEFYLMVETGKVISLHHDATFYEVAGDVWETCDQRVRAFEKRFPEEGALLDIAQLARFQQAFADCDRVEKLGDLDPRDFFARAARAFGWTLTQFQDRMEDTRLEFLYHYARDEEHVLAAMIKESHDRPNG